MRTITHIIVSGEGLQVGGSLTLAAYFFYLLQINLNNGAGEYFHAFNENKCKLKYWKFKFIKDRQTNLFHIDMLVRLPSS